MIAAPTRIDELWPLFWQAAYETLYIVAIVLLLGGLLGLLLGLALDVTRTGGLYQQRLVNALLNLVVNVFRPIPVVIFIFAVQPLARLIVGVGIGNKAIIVALTLAVMFFAGRIVEQSLVSVSPGVVEAARSMGASRLRIIRTVLVPEALAPLVLGYTFTFVALVDATAIAGVVGGGGLGNFALTYGYRQFDTVVTWVTVVAIVVFVQVGQLVGNVVARRIQRR